MDIFGIKNITSKELNFKYDNYYKNIGLDLLQSKTLDEQNLIRKKSYQYLNNLLKNIEVDINILKNNFISLLSDEKSTKYLWILYSKYENNENYIDKLSNILKQENKVFRGGVNIYKMNGWMAHSLYVYQIVNYNIAKNIELFNCNKNKENIRQINEMYIIYNQLSYEAKFLLKIFTLIHDIGVVEDVKSHDKVGGKYVETILNELGLTQEKLSTNNIYLDISEFRKVLQGLINQHVLITAFSSEGSDLYIENTYRQYIETVPETYNLKNDISKILFLLAYADVLAVNESLMNTQKYQRIKDAYNFFDKIYNKQYIKRNKEVVCLERICDIIGYKSLQDLSLNFNYLLHENEINKSQFIEDMYNIMRIRYSLSIMKELKDTSLALKIFYELFELIKSIENEDELKNYTIMFVPDKQDFEFINQFKNGNFFQCIKAMKAQKQNNYTYEDINISIESNNKFLYIRIV